MSIKSIELLRFDKGNSPAQSKPIQAAMRSWRAVYPAIKDLPDTDASIKKLTAMLAFEIGKGEEARPQILERVHMRINAMRYRMELQAIYRTAGIKAPIARPKAS